MIDHSTIVLQLELLQHNIVWESVFFLNVILLIIARTPLYGRLDFSAAWMVTAIVVSSALINVGSEFKEQDAPALELCCDLLGELRIGSECILNP